jgi:hypothetical protein
MIASSTFTSAPFRTRRNDELRRSCAPWAGTETNSIDFIRCGGDVTIIDQGRSRVGPSFSLPKRAVLVRNTESRACTERR